MSQTQEPINLLEYITNDPKQKTEIPTQAVHALMSVLNQVKESETHYVLNHYYNKSAKEIKNGDLVEEVKLESEKFPSASSFFSQEPTIATTMLGVAAQDLLMGLQQVYLQEIEQGKVNKVGTVIAPKNEDIKLT